MNHIDHLSMPAYAHVPGQNDRASDDLLGSIVAMALAVTVDETSQDNIAWRYGLKLINAGFYWEAHEVLEAVWMKAVPNSRERHLVQGVIHVANAALKIRMNRQKAAVRLRELATSCIKRSFEQRDSALMGLTMHDALAAANSAAQSAEISVAQTSANVQAAGSPVKSHSNVHLPLHFPN